MRIRKHMKISPLVYTTSSLEPGFVIQTHACQLNQSMWDVATFSPETSPEPATAPPPHQVSGGGISAVDVTSGEGIRRYMSNGDDPAKTEEPLIVCGKSDGKSWQCRREASKGNSLCEHHLSQAKSYPKSGQTGGRRSEKPVKKSQKSSSSSSNPYEFYYYTGFGPRWGKKRGGESSRNDNGQHEQRDAVYGSMAEFDLMEEDEQYIYEDDDEEDDELGNRKKRARKPVKARSLKSLM